MLLVPAVCLFALAVLFLIQALTHAMKSKWWRFAGEFVLANFCLAFSLFLWLAILQSPNPLTWMPVPNACSKAGGALC